MKYENNLKGTWTVIKEANGKKKIISCLANKLIVDNKKITDTSIIAEKYKNYFPNIEPKETSKIPQTRKNHSQYINLAISSLQKSIKTVYYSLKKKVLVTMTSVQMLLEAIPMKYKILRFIFPIVLLIKVLFLKN